MTMYKSFHPRDDVDNICQEKEEEDSSGLKIVWIHQFDDSKTTLKTSLENRLQRPETTQTAQELTKQ